MNTAKTARTRSVGTKLTYAEYAQVERAAARRGLTVGEWSREKLLRAAGAPGPAATLLGIRARRCDISSRIPALERHYRTRYVLVSGGWFETTRCAYGR